MWLWRSDDFLARFARIALAPAALAYRGGVAVQGALWRAREPREPAIPVISVGNLTVGGTGKTPISAWIAGELVAMGAKPAVVLRGYAGGDEIDVHRRLTPDIPVIANPDRVAGVQTAAARGATVAVLDDAFQHRRIARVSDIVLISADAWDGHVRLLPAGPWREPLSALRRASVVIVTRKAVDPSQADAVVRALDLGDTPTAVAALVLGTLRTLGGEERPLETIADSTVHAVAGVGDASAFFAQLKAAGARVVPHGFRDHHAFTRADADRLAGAAAGAPVVCTLKDAVKLEREWPRGAGPLWYVSQRVEFDRGREAVLASLPAT
jgi:tetraacyldisaccharide 4'-kinase